RSLMKIDLPDEIRSIRNRFLGRDPRYQRQRGSGHLAKRLDYEPQLIGSVTAALLPTDAPVLGCDSVGLEDVGQHLLLNELLRPTVRPKFVLKFFCENELAVTADLVECVLDVEEKSAGHRDRPARLDDLSGPYSGRFPLLPGQCRDGQQGCPHLTLAVAERDVRDDQVKVRGEVPDPDLHSIVDSCEVEFVIVRGVLL